MDGDKIFRQVYSWYAVFGMSLAIFFPERCPDWFPFFNYIFAFFEEIIPSVTGLSANSSYPNTTKFFVICMAIAYPFVTWNFFYRMRFIPINKIGAKQILLFLIFLPIGLYISIYLPFLFSAPTTDLLTYDKGRGPAFYTMAMTSSIGLGFIGSTVFIGSSVVVGGIFMRAPHSVFTKNINKN